jgi:hypothetical protein
VIETINAIDPNRDGKLQFDEFTHVLDGITNRGDGENSSSNKADVGL